MKTTIKELCLSVCRIFSGPTYTIGYLSIDGQMFCDTLEDRIRNEKVYGETAIPEGEYLVTLDQSPRLSGKSWAKEFGGLVPLVHDVPNFAGIRIHPGNTDKDTEGCLLIGKNTEKGKVTNSQYWYKRLMNEYLMPAHEAGTKITLKVYSTQKLTQKSKFI